MRKRRAITIIALLGMMSSLALSVAQMRFLRAHRPAGALEETMFVPSPHVLKRISLGYDGLLADLYWTRAVQYFGEKHITQALRYDLLYPLLDATVTLDPKLIVAYKFGATFLAQRPPAGAGQPDLAVQLVERGIAENPSAWQLYYNLGFIHYFERKDYAAAADVFERGANVPGAHPWLRIMAASTRQHAGEAGMARLLWQQLDSTTNDAMLKQNAVDHLMALDVDERVTQLEALAQQFQSKFGRWPQSFREMAQAGLLHAVPRDPLGYPYMLTAEGKVLVMHPAKLTFITRGLPPDADGLTHTSERTGRG